MRDLRERGRQHHDCAYYARVERDVRDKTLNVCFICDCATGPFGLVWAMGQFFERKMLTPKKWIYVDRRLKRTTSKNGGFFEAVVLRRLDP